MVSELSKHEIPLTEDERRKYFRQENEAIEEIYRLDRPWNSVNTPPTHNDPVLAVVDLARPQDEILRKAWGKPKIKIASYRDSKWDHQGDVLKITHWSELQEMPE